jgi:CRISPR-associated endoribonuclease Cas6
MKYFEVKISTSLKASLHFQKSPEAIGKLISTALIKGGYKEHNQKKPKPYVFSNLGRADEKGYFKEGEIVFRSFDKNLAKMVSQELLFYEDNIFKINSIAFEEVPYRFIEAVVSINPVFVKLKGTNKFWTFNEGDLNPFLSALQQNLIRKYESTFGEKLNPANNFIEYFQIKNRTPQTFIYKGGKLFGNKLYFVPRSDEISQKLAFSALACGLGHMNSSVGGGFCKKIKPTHFD